jgi:hypothetical protein
LAILKYVGLQVEFSLFSHSHNIELWVRGAFNLVPKAFFENSGDGKRPWHRMAFYAF